MVEDEKSKEQRYGQFRKDKEVDRLIEMLERMDMLSQFLHAHTGHGGHQELKTYYAVLHTFAADMYTFLSQDDANKIEAYLVDAGKILAKHERNAAVASTVGDSWPLRSAKRIECLNKMKQVHIIIVKMYHTSGFGIRAEKEMETGDDIEKHMMGT